MAEPPVVDSSPLVVLAKANHLDLLRLEGGTVLVTDAVVSEVRAYNPDAAVRALDDERWLTRTGPVDVPPRIEAWDLGAGESSVIAWALAHPGTTAIMDDLAARRCAAAFDIQCRGCLGLVLIAKKRGVIPRARPIIETLRASGLYLSDEVIRAALSLVGE